MFCIVKVEGMGRGDKMFSEKKCVCIRTEYEMHKNPTRFPPAGQKIKSNKIT